MQDSEQANQAAAHVNEGLHHVGPDHCSQSAFEGVNQGEDRDDCNRGNLASAKRDSDDDRDGVDPNALRGCAREQEQASGKGSQPAPKPALDEFVSSIEVAAKVVRQQNEADKDASDDVSEHNLEKGEIRVISQAGDANDRQRAGLGSHDGQRNCPPRDVAVGKKVVLERALALSEAQTEEGYARQVNGNDGEIESIETHACESEIYSYSE